MKSLSLVVAIVSTLSAFALSGCSSCSQANNTNTPAPAVTCGPGTVAQGSQCVGAVNR